MFLSAVRLRGGVENGILRKALPRCGLLEAFFVGDTGGDSNGHINWSQAQLGLQYDGCFCGRSAWVRAGVEAHDLDNADSGDNDIAPGAFGYFVGAGLSF